MVSRPLVRYTQRSPPPHPLIQDIKKLKTSRECYRLLMSVHKVNTDPTIIDTAFESLRVADSATFGFSLDAQVAYKEKLRGCVCVEILFKILRWCKTREDLKRSFKANFLRYHKSLLFWLELYLPLGSEEQVRGHMGTQNLHHEYAARFVSDFLEIFQEPECLDIILAEDWVFAIVTRMLKGNPEDNPFEGTHSFPLAGSEDCTFGAMLRTLTKPDICPRFIPRLRDSPALAKLLATDIAAKAHILTELTTTTPVSALMQHLFWYVQGIVVIVRSDATLSSIMTPIFTARRMFHSFKTLAERFLGQGSEMGHGEIHKAWGAQILCVTCVLVTSVLWDGRWKLPRESRIKMTVFIVNFLGSISQVQHGKFQGDVNGPLCRAFKFVTLCLPYPDFSSRLIQSRSKALKRDQGGIHKEICASPWVEPGPQAWTSTLNYAYILSERHARSPFSQGYLNFCDNIKCESMGTASSTNLTAAKECSGCHWAAYCSPRCQKEDWKTYHRHECFKADDSTTEVYPPKVRACHISFVNSALLYGGAQRTRWPDYPIFDYTVCPPATAITTWSCSNGREVSGKLQIMLTRMDDDAKTGQPSARFHEAVFPLGTDSRVRLSIMVRTLGELVWIEHCMMAFERSNTMMDGHEYAVEKMADLAAYRDKHEILSAPCPCPHCVDYAQFRYPPPSMARRRGGHLTEAISSELVSRAERGDPKAILAISVELNSSNCDEGLVKIVLGHLRPELVPNIALQQHNVMPYQRYALTAMASLTTLGAMLKIFKSRPALAESASPIITDVADGVCMWINYMLHYGISINVDTGADFRQSYLVHARIVSDLMDCHPHVLNALLSGPRFIDLLIRFWMAEGDDGDAHMDITGPTPCPILSVMLKTVKQEMGREALLQRIRGRPRSFCSRFADKVKLRAIQVIEVEISSQKAVAYIEAILSVTEILLADKEPVDLRRNFIKTSYLLEFATVLNAISMEAGYSGEVNSIMPGIIRPTYKLFGLVMAENARAAHNYRELLEGDIMSHMVRLLAWLPHHDRASADLCNALVRMLGIYTIYPSVIKHLSQSKLPDQLIRKPYENPLVAHVWESFISAIRVRTEVHRAMPTGLPNLCDNFLCNLADRSSDSPQRKLRACSGCSSVVYCSQKCQRQDWEEHHREECKHASLDDHRRRSSGTRYSHATRAFHAHFIASTYNDRHTQLQQECDKFYPTIAFNQILPVLQCTSIEFGINLEPMVPIPRDNPHYEKLDLKTAWWERGDKTAFEQGWLRPRASQLIEGYRDGTIGSTEVRVVEGAFPMGPDYVVFVTVRLEKASSGKWEPAYCVPRYGTNATKSSIKV